MLPWCPDELSSEKASGASEGAGRSRSEASMSRATKEAICSRVTPAAGCVGARGRCRCVTCQAVMQLMPRARVESPGTSVYGRGSERRRAGGVDVAGGDDGRRAGRDRHPVGADGDVGDPHAALALAGAVRLRRYGGRCRRSPGSDGYPTWGARQ